MRTSRTVGSGMRLRTPSCSSTSDPSSGHSAPERPRRATEGTGAGVLDVVMAERQRRDHVAVPDFDHLNFCTSVRDIGHVSETAIDIS
ncbi:hypothetical protein STVIR_4575 [Streptomyces viridochromogenes Tue57]|uniref:Uncharacterized protein n=1 Tax=Streptomyces viridochromogenes Tue57 TaxID=1160705 RepID=L8PAA1_STRVR|nr:hypothetical protein STVIR_4575 [Streptomyces viridochromogenes Tue57]